MITEISAKSILRKMKGIDSWFVSSYGLNLYRGCTHNCVYCDGRDERYQVDGEFGSDVAVKVNALELLKRELDPARRRKPFNGGYIIVGGGVCDSYQPAERKYGLTRGALELMQRFGHPVHMLTKSTLVERDADLLKRINGDSGAIVSFSFSSADDELGAMLEPGVPPPSERLDLIRRLTAGGLTCGAFLMPAVPMLTDSAEMLQITVSRIKEAGASFIIFGGMTLKPGRQKDYFFSFLRQHRPDLLKTYNRIYGNNSPWGSPDPAAAEDPGDRFSAAARRAGIARRVPARLFSSLVTRTELTILILEQLDYLAGLDRRNNPYGRVARELKKSGLSVESASREQLLVLPGIGPFTADLIGEITETGRCGFYEKML